MQTRTHSSLLLVYIGAIFTALAVIALGLMAIVQASAALFQSSPQEKTVLELQVETARESRRALAVPVVIPPLPPITASLARDVRAVATAQVRKPARRAIPTEALNAMAMDQSEATPRTSHSYAAPDRHAIAF
jgi:hypothetical protein